MGKVTIARHNVELVWGVPTRDKLESILPEPWRVLDVVKQGDRKVAYCIARVAEDQRVIVLARALIDALARADEEYFERTAGSAEEALAKLAQAKIERATGPKIEGVP